jgi:hypothetical protein
VLAPFTPAKLPELVIRKKVESWYSLVSRFSCGGIHRHIFWTRGPASYLQKRGAIEKKVKKFLFKNYSENCYVVKLPLPESCGKMFSKPSPWISSPRKCS